MRILVVSNLYPPLALGGYEVECAGVVERLSLANEVCVLSATAGAGVAPQPGVRRELSLLTPDARGAVRAPGASLRAVRSARAALAWGPELIYLWNGSSVPQAALRVLADSGLPVAFRICEHWFGRLFAEDQFMRELIPARRSPPRAAWSLACHAVNLLPGMRLAPLAPMRAAICWNAESLRRAVPVPSFLEPALERVVHSVPRYGELYEQVERAPAEDPEIVFLGRVTPYKGLDVAVRALALVRENGHPRARLIVVGPEDAGHGQQMRRLAGELGVAESLTWLGQQTPQQAADVLARAHALIVPSVWEEPFPLVTIEGAMARVPIVASDVGGIGEGMHHEEHALLFPRADAPAAAAALSRVLDHPQETAVRVARARERAEEFRLGPYLDAQERFVADAHAALVAPR